MAERVVGRRRLAAAARLVTNEVRLDTPNDMEANGEALVQRAARLVEEPVVFDVGARFGEWTESLLRQPGTEPTVHAFEPSSWSFQQASDALAGRAIVHKIALSSERGYADLNVVHDGAGTNSLVRFGDTGRLGVEHPTERVEISTVSAVAEAEGISRITLLKIDAEGHDLAVIQGARGLTDEQRVDLIQFEYNWRWVGSRAFLLDAFEELQPRGYRLGKVTRRGIELYPRWHHELERFVEGNYLAWLPQWDHRLPTIPWWGG